VRLVFDLEDGHTSHWAAIESAAAKIGCTAREARMSGSSARRATLADGKSCRFAMEPVIGPRKAGTGMGRCHLKESQGQTFDALVAAA
jgi:hypothetical protein